MVNDSYKSKAKSIIEKAKEKKAIKTYSEFCKTNTAKNNTLSKKEINYYTSKNRKEKK